MRQEYTWRQTGAHFLRNVQHGVRVTFRMFANVHLPCKMQGKSILLREGALASSVCAMSNTRHTRHSIVSLLNVFSETARFFSSLTRELDSLAEKTTRYRHFTLEYDAIAVGIDLLFLSIIVFFYQPFSDSCGGITRCSSESLATGRHRSEAGDLHRASLPRKMRVGEGLDVRQEGRDSQGQVLTVAR
jgi:hypothetical protein